MRVERAITQAEARSKERSCSSNSYIAFRAKNRVGIWEISWEGGGLVCADSPGWLESRRGCGRCGAARGGNRKREGTTKAGEELAGMNVERAVRRPLLESNSVASINTGDTPVPPDAETTPGSSPLLESCWTAGDTGQPRECPLR